MLNKPAFIGMCILELAKVLMYEFHHNYIKDEYGSNSKLLLTEIDNLTNEIKTEGVYEDFTSDKEIIDFNN